MNEDPQLSTSASRPGYSKKRGGGNLSLDAVPSAPGWEEKFVIHILADRSWPGDSGDRDWLTQIVQRWQRKREIQWLVGRQYTEQKPGDCCLLSADGMLKLLARLSIILWTEFYWDRNWLMPGLMLALRAGYWRHSQNYSGSALLLHSSGFQVFNQYNFIQFGRANRKADRLNMRGTTYEGESDLTLPRKNFYFPIL